MKRSFPESDAWSCRVGAWDSALWRSLFAIPLTLTLLTCALPCRASVPPMQAVSAITDRACSALSSISVAHLYLFDAAEQMIDVTDTFLQTGTVYDPIRGYPVAMGRVTDGAGKTLEVIVDFVEGDVFDWGMKRVGLVVSIMEDER